MGRPDVSVLVLAYDHGPYIGQCLDGVLSQDFDGSLEVLVGEDCSTDDTLDVVRHYARKDSRVHVVTSAQNVGMHQNHARLVRAARGRYVAYCEGDDYWHDPHKLDRQIAMLDQDERMGGCHTDFDHITFVRGRWRRRPDVARNARRIHDDTTYEQLLEQNLVQTCTLVVRREAARAYLESDFGHLRFAVDDWPLCLYVARTVGRLGFDPVSTASYRHVPGSVTNSGWVAQVERIRDQHRLIDAAAEHLGGDPIAVALGHRHSDEAMVRSAYLAGNAALAKDAFERLRPVGRTPALLRALRAVKATPLGFRLNSLGLRAVARSSLNYRYR